MMRPQKFPNTLVSLQVNTEVPGVSRDRGSGAGTLGVPLEGTRRVGGLLGVAGRLSGTVSPFRAHRLQFRDLPGGNSRKGDRIPRPDLCLPPSANEAHPLKPHGLLPKTFPDT